MWRFKGPGLEDPVAELEDIAVPDIGDFTDVAVVEVHVAPGDEVAENDPLITLETDKATMDVPAPFGGTIAELALKVGDTASEGTLVARLQPAVEANARTEAAAPSAVRTAVAAEASARPREDEPPAPKAPSAEGNGGEPVYASPSVRRLARELGVDLGSLSGSGRKGRIVPEDVRAFANGGAPPPAAPPGAPAGAAATGGDLGGLSLIPWPTVDFEKFGAVERVPLSRIRKLSAANLARNWVHIPHVTHNDEADITDLEAFRKQLNAEQSDVKVTMVALLLKATVASLRKFPDMNSSLDGDDLVQKKYYHLGFAADTPNGLVVPVIRDVDRKGILEVASELTELSGKARAGKLGPNEMAGGTFTISSLGGIGGTSFTPIVNAPQVGILGVVRSAMKPVWDGKEFVGRLMLPLSLSYDHRVIDGAAAARFTAHLSGVLTDLRRILL
jgi:pyruvate dehydrogenase E2 component (dihydrolipoamide acetyltransferase)